MPCEEKNDMLLDIYLMETAASYAFYREQGTIEEWMTSTLEVMREAMGAFKMMGKPAPGESFKQIAHHLIYMQQVMQPLSEIEVSWVSDRETVMEFSEVHVLRLYPSHLEGPSGSPDGGKLFDEAVPVPKLAVIHTDVASQDIDRLVGIFLGQIGAA